MTPAITLSEFVDRYLLARRINNPKYYEAYLADAIRVWKDLFQNTLWITASKRAEIKKGEQYDYVELPKCAVRIFSFSIEDECGNLVPLFYNDQINVIPQPKKKKFSKGCGCDGEVCEAVNSTIYTTKLMFTINGKDYFETKWTEYCDDGCIIEYTETPVKKFNDRIGDGGDFNGDYNDDYLIGSAGLANFEIVYEKSNKVICELKTKSCGCPEETEENNEKLVSCCACYQFFVILS